MAVRSVANTDTLDTFRTTYNLTAGTDIGDMTTLATSASSIVGAINEVRSATLLTGWIISDGGTTQTVHAGNTLTIAGTSNEVDVAVSSTDTLTIGLPNNVTLAGTLTVSTIANATSDLDKFLVSDSGVIKYRTGAEFASDVGTATQAFAIAQAVALGQL